MTRRRLHPPQKLCVMDVTNDTAPSCPSMAKFLPTSLRASSPGRVARRSDGCARSIVARASAYDTTLFVSHLFPSKGMYSMKRTFTGASRVRATKSRISSSFTPRISTTFTFTGSYPSSTAARIERITRS